MYNIELTEFLVMIMRPAEWREGNPEILVTPDPRKASTSC